MSTAEPPLTDEARIAHVLQTAGALVPVDALQAAWQARQAPPVRWLVVGRRSAGKSRLINRLVGADAAVGLGSVTTSTARHGDGAIELIDSPGIEDDLDGADLIEAELPDADGLLWVVDGLQPLTSLERRAVDRAVPPEVPLVVVISRLDLVEPQEHASIIDRVRRLLAERAPRAVLPGHGPLEVLRSTLAQAPPWRRAPRRRQTVQAALRDLGRALDHLSHATGPDPDALAEEAVQRWHGHVQEAHDDIAARVRDLVILFRDEALTALHARLVQAAADVLSALKAELGEAPRWTPSSPAALDLAGQARDLLGGTRAVLDGLAVGAEQWRAEGERALRALDGLAGVRALRERRQAVEVARAAVAGLIESDGARATG